MSGLARGFSRGRPSLVVYLMAGYPDRATSLAGARAAIAAGADVIELGVPYGDAVADGPTIAAAGHAARMQLGGFALRDALDLAAELASDPDAPPIALMTYVNPILRVGLAETARAAASAGVAGFIVPDLPPGGPVASEWVAVARAERVDTVFLVAPTSTSERMEEVAGASTGFVYCVSTTGITGARADLAPDLADLVGRARRHTDLPVAVGFGVSTPEQAAAVARVADGVVVGSAVVERQAEPGEVERFVRSLATAVHGAP